MKQRKTPIIELVFFTYISKLYARNLTVVLAGLLLIVYLFDTVELMRRAQGKENITTGLLLEMGLLKLPEVGQAILPFVVLVAAMFTLWSLARSSELTVMRGVGLSPLKMLTPMVIIVLALGAAQITIINPLGAALVSKFDRLESKYLKRQTSQIAMFEHGMWLLQEADEKGADAGSYIILHARKVGGAGRRLQDVSALSFNSNDSQRLRVDAAHARLDPNRWMLEDAVLHKPSQIIDGAVVTPPPTQEKTWGFKTNLTPIDIAKSFADDKGMAFWALPRHIKVLEETGFDASGLRVSYHHMMAAPFIFVAMVLLAAAIFVRHARGSNAMVSAIIGLVGGLCIFFFVQFCEALGLSGQLPPFISAWAPALLSLLMAGGLVLRLEEG